MQIEFKDSETCLVRVDVSVVEEASGEPVEDGTRVYEIDLHVDDDPYYSPRLRHCMNYLEFPTNPNRPYSLSTVALNLDSRYRIDEDEDKFSKIMERVEEDWWQHFGNDYYEWQSATHEEPGYWSKRK